MLTDPILLKHYIQEYIFAQTENRKVLCLDLIDKITLNSYLFGNNTGEVPALFKDQAY